MPAKRKSMKSIREVLRLRFECNLSYRKISNCTGVSLGCIKSYLSKMAESNLEWPLDESLCDDQLYNLLFPINTKEKYPGLSFQKVQSDLKKTKGVTRQLLYEEYQQTTIATVPSYSQFCRDYRAWLKTHKPSYRHHYVGGEQCQVDYCGPTVPVQCPETGQIKRANVFVGVLCASNYTYAEATWTQSLPDWIQSHINMYQYFGGSPELTLIDNLKSGVTKACRFEPTINQTYQQLGAHYHTTIFPVRPHQPKDKGKAENAVLVVERWILARLRKQTFFSLDELNQAIRALLDDLNHRPFKSIPGCRHSQFIEIDKPALRALPSRPFEYFESVLMRVGKDYHFEFEQHYYSVPYHLANKQVELKVTKGLIKVYHQHQLVATHQRSKITNGSTTVKEHQPISHQKVATEDSEQWLDWGLSIGPRTAECILNICTEHHPMRAHRICIGIHTLAKSHGAERLEAACAKSLVLGHVSHNSLKLMLKNGLESSEKRKSEHHNSIEHQNIRGADYYQPQHGDVKNAGNH